MESFIILDVVLGLVGRSGDVCADGTEISKFVDAWTSASRIRIHPKSEACVERVLRGCVPSACFERRREHQTVRVGNLSFTLRHTHRKIDSIVHMYLRYRFSSSSSPLRMESGTGTVSNHNHSHNIWTGKNDDDGYRRWGGGSDGASVVLQHNSRGYWTLVAVAPR